MDLKQILKDFLMYVKKNNLELYNEFSFQHELGIYLRLNLPSYKIQFERNIIDFYNNSNTIKKYIVIINDNEKYAIELKYPKNGQYPEQMFSFIKDIKFMEEVKELGFTSTYVMTIVDDHNFYTGNIGGIYSFLEAIKS
ncbi:MAG: hypothetical protein J6Y28_00040 [Acholeplasmatales bacterium]|nr:hypothetical protein [Acholeplasmatales bacterium]